MRALVVLIVLVLGGALALAPGDADAAPQVETAPVIEVVDDVDPAVAATAPPVHALSRPPRGLATALADQPPPADPEPPPVPPPRR